MNHYADQSTVIAAIYSTYRVEDIQEAITRQGIRIMHNSNLGQDPLPETVAINQMLAQKLCYSAHCCERYRYKYLRMEWRNGKIVASWYRDDAALCRDLRTVGKPEKALCAILDLSSDHARDIVRELYKAADRLHNPPVITLEQLHGRDAIRSAFTSGLTKSGSGSTSCMDHSRKPSLHHTCCSTGETVHPCDAYDHPSIRIMAIFEDGEMVCRFVAPAARDQFYALYTREGEGQLWSDWLKSNGWDCNSALLRGCRLTLIYTDNGKLLMPYIDSDHSSMDSDGDLGYGSYTCDHSDGTASGYGYDYYCHECGEGMGEDDSIYIDDEDIVVCQCCLERRFVSVYTSRRDMQYMRRTSDDIYEHDGYYYTYEALDYHNLCMTHDGDIISQDDAVYDNDGDCYHIDDAKTCPISGDAVLPHDAENWHGVDIHPVTYREQFTRGTPDCLTDWRDDDDDQRTPDDVIADWLNTWDDADAITDAAMEYMHSWCRDALRAGRAAGDLFDNDTQQEAA